MSSLIVIALTLAIAAILYFVLSKIVEKTGKTADLQQIIVLEVNWILKRVIGSLAFISILGALGIDITGLIAGQR